MNFAANQSVVYKGETVKIVGIKGRWIKLSNGKNVGAKDIAPVAEKTVSAEGRKNGVVPATYLETYARVKLDSGTVTRDSGDDVAIMLRGKELDETYKVVAHKLGVTQVSLHTRFDHLNPGQQRMCLGNMLRKALRDADKA